MFRCSQTVESRTQKTFFFSEGGTFCALIDYVCITPENVCFTVGFNNVEGDRLLHYSA